MFARILLLFLLTPVVELALLIQLGEYIGFWNTIALIAVTGVAGSYLAKREGLSVWKQFNRRLTEGALPGNELVDGVIILTAGALLITPGVLTDVIGFIGLVPASRKLVRKLVIARIRRAMKEGRVNVFFGGSGTSARHERPSEEPSPEEMQWRGRAEDVPHHERPNKPPSPPSEGNDH